MEGQLAACQLGWQRRSENASRDARGLHIATSLRSDPEQENLVGRLPLSEQKQTQPKSAHAGCERLSRWYSLLLIVWLLAYFELQPCSGAGEAYGKLSPGSSRGYEAFLTRPIVKCSGAKCLTQVTHGRGPQQNPRSTCHDGYMILLWTMCS